MFELFFFSIGNPVRCFAGDSLIQLSNGTYKQMKYLKSGDQILTIHQTKIISTQMILMLDKQSSTQGTSNITLIYI